MFDAYHHPPAPPVSINFSKLYLNYQLSVVTGQMRDFFFDNITQSQESKSKVSADEFTAICHCALRHIKTMSYSSLCTVHMTFELLRTIWFKIIQLNLRRIILYNKYHDYSPYLRILKLHVSTKVDEQTMLFFYIQAFLLPEDEVTEVFILFFISHPSSISIYI